MKINTKIINLELWKDFFDECWRIKVVFWKWEVARFRVDPFADDLHALCITRVEKGKK
jgi:hypothetical protein